MALPEIESKFDRTGWIVCPRCRTLVYAKRWSRNDAVCPECGRHAPLSAPERISRLLDPGSVVPLIGRAYAGDPLCFVDTKPYPDRLRDARARTGLDEAVVCVRGAVEGHPVIAAVMDFRFMGGSLGGAVGELITLAAERACAERTPLLLVTASGGARMQEGMISLMQMAKTSAALALLDEAGVLTITLVTDPTFGGVAASFATLSDVILTEPGARLGFAGPRVIAQTIRQSLPSGFQTAEYLLEHGMVDLVTPRAELRGTVARLLAAGDRRGSPAPLPESGDILVREPELLPERDPWTTVGAARALERPTTRDFIAHLTSDFEELHGDRLGDDCAAILGGVARFEGRPVVVIGHQKGHSLDELTRSNFGMAAPSGYRKSARLMRLAAKLGLPVLTFVDTPGAYPGIEAESQGQSNAIAENLRLMARLPVPIIGVITGEGGSGGALALAVADRVLMFADGVYSVISPEGCAAILWQDSAAAPVAAAALKLDARELLRLGVVDGVVPAPDRPADHAAAALHLRNALITTLRELESLSPGRLLADRLARYRRFGESQVSAASDASADPAGQEGGTSWPSRPKTSPRKSA